MSAVIRDADGREIEVQMMTTLERRRFIRNMGRAADSDRWFGEALLAAQVRAIGGVPVTAPTTPDQADALVGRLDVAGLNAVAEWASNLAPVDVDQAKNSQGTPIS